MARHGRPCGFSGAPSPEGGPISHRSVPFPADDGAAALRCALRQANGGERELIALTRELEIELPEALRPEEALHAEGLLDAFRGYDEYRGRCLVPADPWDGCSKRVARIGHALLETSRFRVRDAGTLLQAFELATELSERLPTETVADHYLRVEMPRRLGMSLDRWRQAAARRQVHSALREQEENDILQALGV